ncbi:hypothetical protein POTOM_023257 [Populus tomentosa]|uniref:Uncharacterized protein n=1 Tax=Populus tomentosa TaxID=118781 RepID=A0A8X8CYV8_POPTO|nr:hypothetical protein POTOM_023257 [Populus tomentosa]
MNHISVSSFHTTLYSCLGADNGDVYVVPCNLRSTFWERSFLHISITSSRSFLHNGICQNKITNLRTGVEACEAD